MMGEVGILNVGAGDTKLVFDVKDPDAMAKAARIVEDMIKRGYKIMVEIERGGKSVPGPRQKVQARHLRVRNHGRAR